MEADYVVVVEFLEHFHLRFSGGVGLALALFSGKELA